MPKNSESLSGKPNTPRLVWDSTETAKTSLRKFFSKCAEHQIEVQPLTKWLLMASASCTVSRMASGAVEEMLSSGVPIFSKRKLRNNVNMILANSQNIDSIINECLKQSNQA